MNECASFSAFAATSRSSRPNRVDSCQLSPFLNRRVRVTAWRLPLRVLFSQMQHLMKPYATHLLGDALTVGGIPIWSPFSSRRVSLSHMRTGSRQEYALAVVMLLWTCVFGWRLLPEDVKLTHQMIYEKLAASQSQSPT